MPKVPATIISRSEKKRVSVDLKAGAGKRVLYSDEIYEATKSSAGGSNLLTKMRTNSILTKSEFAELVNRLPLSTDLRNRLIALHEKLLPILESQARTSKSDSRKANITVRKKSGPVPVYINQQNDYSITHQLNPLYGINRVVYDPKLSEYYHSGSDEDLIIGDVVPDPKSGVPSMFNVDIVDHTNVLNYIPEDANALYNIGHQLRNLGFEILCIGKLSMTIRGKRINHKTYFPNWFPPREAPFPHESSDWVYQSTVNKIDNIIISPNRIMPTAPENLNYYYLKAPGDIRDKLNAKSAIDSGFDGKDINIVLIDSGLCRHPYFSYNNFNISSILSPDLDINNDDPYNDNDPEHIWGGHGTMVCANIFCCAPKANVTMIKWYRTQPILNLIFAEQLKPKPDIMSISWGALISNSSLPLHRRLTDYDKLLAATVAYMTRQNIILVFAAGDYGIDLAHPLLPGTGAKCFPAQHPDVIAAGGAYITESGELQASNYSSGYESDLRGYKNQDDNYTETSLNGRVIPDMCGLVGQKPFGIYLALPTSPGSDIDKFSSTIGDETPDNDGWVVLSGTSSSTAQLAGVCAILQNTREFIIKNLGLIPFWTFDPDDYKAIMQVSAKDVPKDFGESANGNRPLYGPDLATGYGLVDAISAVTLAIYALLFCPSNTKPSEWLRESVLPRLHE